MQQADVPALRRSVAEACRILAFCGMARAGQADARSHGWRGACVLRGHGVTTVGATIAQAVIHALNLEALAKITLGVARACGQPSELSPPTSPSCPTWAPC
jgi:ribulose-5-phosphate 4-epimerase/fuculose-1-phosphate aldolase